MRLLLQDAARQTYLQLQRVQVQVHLRLRQLPAREMAGTKTKTWWADRIAATTNGGRFVTARRLSVSSTNGAPVLTRRVPPLMMKNAHLHSYDRFDNIGSIMHKILFALALFSIGIVALAGCSTGSTGRPELNQTVTSGWIKVFPGQNDMEKRCDGTNLIYVKYGTREQSIAVVPNSPECISK